MRHKLTDDEMMRGALKSKPNLHSKPSNLEETETNMFDTVLKTRVRCKSQKVYHRNPSCKKLLSAKTILKGRLGSVLAAGYKRHC